VSLWLNAGVPAPQVAEWAGRSAHVLMKVYAKCIDGQQAAAKKRIENALRVVNEANPLSGREDLDQTLPRICRDE
jgi:hypothetical protein